MGVNDLGDVFSFDCTSGALTLQIPGAGGLFGKPGIVVRRSDATANALTITAPGAETIDGQGSIVLIGKNNEVTLMPDPDDGTNWITTTPLTASSIIGSHFAGSGGVPAIAAGVGLDSGGTGTATDAGASDTCGLLTLTAAGTPTGSNAIVATVTYAVPYVAKPRAVIIHPANAAATALAVGAKPFVDDAACDATKFVIKSGATALPTGVYLFYFLVVQ